MASPPPGWYPDPESPQLLRWWDGASWDQGSARYSIGQAVVQKKSQGLKWFVGVTGLITLIGLVSGGVPAVLIILGIVGTGVGLIALARGGASAFHIAGRKASAIVAGASVLAIIVGGVSAAAVNTGQSSSNEVVSFAATSPSASASPTPRPDTSTSHVEERVSIPFTSTTVDNPDLELGTSAVSVVGSNGERVITYRVTVVDGVEKSREVVSDVVSVDAINEVISNGTRQPPAAFVAPPAEPSGCHPSYADVCVPFASDVDCAGGSGNGPAYAEGPLRVVGTDEYDLDRDGDGIACD